MQKISTTLAKVNLNIIDLLNRSQDEVAYTLLDIDQIVPTETVQLIKDIEGVLSVRVL